MQNKIYFHDELDSFETYKDLDGKGGVYMLLSKESHVLYVGMTSNLRKRLSSHIADKGKVFLHFSVMFIEDYGKRSMTEDYMINIHKPVYNKRIPKLERSNDDIYMKLSGIHTLVNDIYTRMIKLDETNEDILRHLRFNSQETLRVIQDSINNLNE